MSADVRVINIALFGVGAWYLLRGGNLFGPSQPTTWTPVQTQPPGAQQGGRITLPGMPNAATSLVGGCASGAATGAAGGPIGAIVGCGAGFIGSGIAQLGWFRGGEEGVAVNPARDEFKLQFVPFNPYRNDPNVRSIGDAGFHGLAWLLHELGRDDLMTAFNRAETMKEFEQTVNDIAGLIATNEARVRALAEHARAQGFGYGG